MSFKGLANAIFLGALMWLLLWQTHSMAWRNGTHYGWQQAQRHALEMQRLGLPVVGKGLHAGS